MTRAPLLKRFVARALDRVGLLPLDLAVRGTQLVLAIGYHDTPARWAHRLDEHFAFYRERFQCLGEAEMLAFLTGSLRLRRTGILISFDDGHRSHGDVAAPLLERHGLHGWFMVPGGFLDEPELSQPDYFRRHIRPDRAAPTRAMSWETARGLVARGHTIGCHTWTHRPLGPSVSPSVIENEVVGAKDKLEQKLGSPVRTFCWARGQPEDYSARAHEAVVRSYDLGLMTMGRAIAPNTSPHALQRFNVEAADSRSVARFQMSRFNEMFFSRRQRALTSTLAALA